MKLRIKIILLFITCCLSCNAQKISNEKLLEVFNKYRETKSLEYALHGGRWGRTPEVEKYKHKDFYSLANNFRSVIYVLNDDFEFEDIRIDNDKHFVSRYGQNNTYDLNEKEIIIGKIINNKVEYFTPEERWKCNGGCLFVLDKGIPLVYLDVMFDAYYVLEKHVPILLERLKRTGEKY